MIAPTTSRRLQLVTLLYVLVVATASAQAPLSFIAVGDAGYPGEPHRLTAAAINTVASRLWSQQQRHGLLIFLGDNFYPNGLNDRGTDWIALRDQVMRPFEPVMRLLGRANVRAIAGNHDYYCDAVNFIPFGFCMTGNERERAIAEWSYSYYFPSSIRRALVEGGSDSVEFILFDSAYLLTRPTLFWRRALDSLERLMRKSAMAPGVRWRIFTAHHSPRTIGEHAGWRRWMPNLQRVGYIGNCLSEGQDPFRYVYEFFSTQDNCHERYRRYVDTLHAITSRSGAKIQVLIAGHDHSLQLMHYPDYGCDACAKVFVVSGAGSKQDRVKSPTPPREFSHPLNDADNRGRSVAGFVVGSFAENRLTFEFVNSRTAAVVDMGGGRTRFTVDESGALVD